MAHIFVALLMLCREQPATPTNLCQFPPREIVRHNRNIAQENMRRHMLFIEIDQRDESLLAANDARRLFVIWDTLDDACIATTLFSQAEAIDRLCNLIGREAFWSGSMPPLGPSARIESAE